MQINIFFYFIHSDCIHKIGNNPNFSSAGEWINKLWYIHTVEYYSPTKELCTIPATTWMNLECIMIMNEARVTRLYSVCIHYDDIPEKAKLEGQTRDQWLPGLENGVNG